MEHFDFSISVSEVCSKYSECQKVDSDSSIIHHSRNSNYYLESDSELSQTVRCRSVDRHASDCHFAGLKTNLRFG